MKKQLQIILIPMVAFAMSTWLLSSCKSQSDHVKMEVNWPSFMSQQDMVWDELPMRWENAPFNGNGLVGSMLHVAKDSTSLRLLLGRSDIGKLDYPGHFKDPNRLQLGSIDLKTKGKILSEGSSLRLNLWDSEISGQIKTTEGTFKLRTFVAEGEPLLVFETFDAEGNEDAKNWQTNFNNNGALSEENGLQLYEVADTTFHERSDEKSGGHVIAWQQKQLDNRNQLLVSINASPTTHGIWNKSERGSLSAKQDALLTFSNIQHKSVAQLFVEQSDWWHDFYTKSFISFGNKELESYYWIQLYKMASSSRAGYPMIDNHGVWSVEPVYGFATWDLNVQIIYRLHMASNHLELSEPLTRFLEENYNAESMFIDSLGELRAGLRQQTFLRYQYFDPIYWEHDNKSPCDGPAKFLWGCHNYWLHFQYTKDSTMLPKLRDMLEGGVNAMKSGMVNEQDGKWHVPYGHSWETWRGKDPNAHLAVLNWALETIINIEKDDSKLTKWKEFQSGIPDYVISEKGYMLGEGKEAKPHRHWSHLLHLYPLSTTVWEENKELYETSVNTWTDLSTGIINGVSKSGYAPCGAMCLYAQTGEASRLGSLMNVFLYGKSSRGPNVWASTMYREFGPVIETPLFFAASLQELFLQSKGNTIKVFPAVPDFMGDVTFHDYRTEGGFLISAKRVNGNTALIKIESLLGMPLLLVTDLENLQAANDNVPFKKKGDGKFEIKLKKGESLLLYNTEFENQLSIEPTKVQLGHSNGFGLNNRFFANRSYLKAFNYEGR